ncbi:EAL domain-containing protein [uncultured Erythrobacter sp.]|uniref:putative bifunctional diguanylate cyclase/phosphodiesterase n=1 Tax=uncultured Erythrobacter sp. TaxID=263913 RepID=UPI00260B93DD|nr:EAL domain-containing protein [uncultured Erythrobacter sp.]
MKSGVKMPVVRRPVALAAASIVDEIYRPVWRGYFAAFALYYLIMLPTHFLDYSGIERSAMVLVATAAACVGLCGFWQLGRKGNKTNATPLLLLMNGLIVLNVLLALNISYVEEKLLYFLIMAVAFALASSSFKQAVFSIGLAAVALASFANQTPQQTFVTYAFLAFGTAIAGLSIAYLMKRALWQIAIAKIKSEEELDEIANAKRAVEFELSNARQAGEEMRKKSLSDSLTGLPNRRAFFEKMESIQGTEIRIGNSIEPPKSTWLLLIDLDGFKAVNDTHGHLVGDRLLQAVADRLRSFASADLFVSRMGGDEFNLILESDQNEGGIERLCHGLLGSLSEDYRIAGRRIKISASIGCKIVDHLNPVRSDIRKADYVLRVAKNQGKNRFVVFDGTHAEAADSRHKIENALREADLGSELCLVFQPQLDLGTGQIVRAEALVRWSSPIVGNVGPDRFIKIAEETGLITDLTLAVIKKAFGAMQAWPAPVPLSINLSSHDVTSDVMIDQIIAYSGAMEINPELVELEVTETAMLADFEKANRNLKRLADAGFLIALDDFGTGYSNFNYLRNLPISKLKIDRSFMEKPGDPMTEKILFSLAGMARTLGVHCLLEGVENEVDLLIAKRVGAETVQGFHFGKPMSERELLRAFEGQEGSSAALADIRPNQVRRNAN